MLRLQGDVIGAIEAFKVTQQFAIDNEFKQLEASTHYSVAYCFAMLDNWPKCQTHFKSFVETPIEIANKNFRPWAGTRMNAVDSAHMCSLFIGHVVLDAG